tara:strand:+ start:1148 stop:2056 length:909 start_codon:yes stop_codon:yes gene_type:complete
MFAKLKIFTRYFLTIFNSHVNIFSNEKVLKNRFFNFFGCQILRILIFRFILSIKRIFFFRNEDYKSVVTKVDELENKGYLIFDEFLKKEEFNKLKLYYQKNLENDVSSQEDRYRDRISISQRIANKQALNKIADPWYEIILKNNDLGKIIEFVTAKKLCNMKNSSIYFEKLFQTNDKKDLPQDPQNYFHRDTFYTSLKFIYYMDDILIEDGPFSYVEKSNKISKWKIKTEFFGSLKRNNKNLRETSVKLDFSKHKIMNFCLKENSLILVDVSGFHRRLPTKINKGRETIRFSSREHPFSLSI